VENLRPPIHALGDELETLEVNRLWVRGEEIEALDGLTVWSSSPPVP
jgi:hypothetical protein